MPEEFGELIGYNEKILKVRRWHFVGIDEIPDVLYDVVLCGLRRIKVAKIGNGIGNMPLTKCWWLNANVELADEISTVQAYGSSLSSFQHPSPTKTRQVQSILTKWMSMSGKFIYL